MIAALVVVLVLAAGLAGVLAVVVARRGQRLAAASDAVVALARAMSDDGGSREHLVHAARQIAGADVALLAEPARREPELVVTAADGPGVEGLRVPLDAATPIVRAFTERETIHEPDLARVDGPRELGPAARSAHLHPVLRAGVPVGVLGLGWSHPVRALAAERRELVDLLAGEAARAIERDARHAVLARQARTDELTALPNRRAWDEAVERELSRSQRTGAPLSLGLLDLDHFKAYNDSHGHQAGDAHLRRTAAAWRRELRTVDVLARYGGEEFGVLLPATALPAAIDAVDRVRAATPHEQTASGGVVQWDGRESAEALLARADTALYRAKDAGRSLTLSA